MPRFKSVDCWPPILVETVGVVFLSKVRGKLPDFEKWGIDVELAVIEKSAQILSTLKVGLSHFFVARTWLNLNQKQPKEPQKFKAKPLGRGKAS